LIFSETPLAGAYLITLEPHLDARGSFARTFCRREFEAHGLNTHVAQCNISSNRKAGTLRGMHYQRPPGSEAKLVRCIRGAVHDVIIDLRPDSATRGRHFGVDLTEENGTAVFIPQLFAHGFQSLADETEVEYVMSDFYQPELSAGFRYDDTAFGIRWPLPVAAISDQDLAWPAFQ
jgi:dTDP-4-dehydrorhamnose 3,5-epimerase